MKRLLPERPLPAYRYLPGRAPHPTRDPKGHSYTGRPEHAPPACPLPEQWRDSSDYLYGIDLLNHGYYWEAHEAWESCWQGSPAGSQQQAFLQGLIQVAAAGVQNALGSTEGASRVLERGLGRLEHVAQTSDVFMGVVLADFIDETRAAFRERSGPPRLAVLPD